jgi:hypothetical protein
MAVAITDVDAAPLEDGALLDVELEIGPTRRSGRPRAAPAKAKPACSIASGIPRARQSSESSEPTKARLPSSSFGNARPPRR